MLGIFGWIVRKGNFSSNRLVAHIEFAFYHRLNSIFQNGSFVVDVVDVELKFKGLVNFLYLEHESVLLKKALLYTFKSQIIF